MVPSSGKGTSLETRQWTSPKEEDYVSDAV